MASDPAMAINGNYASHASYGLSDQNYTSHQHTTAGSGQPDYNAHPASSDAAASGNGEKAEIPKDEVGWYFVEQYYTNLSKAPEKLHLFYAKQSQFVSGLEAEKAPVCVGQKAISERIKELGFQDCKVRVTNVDSQGSGQNIVIQVIGEISNKSDPHRKFTQTFVLAEQANGYFVLNDIFRYIADEETEYEEAQNPEVAYKEAAPPAADSAAKELPPVQSTLSADKSAKVADERIEQAAKDSPKPKIEEVNGTAGGTGNAPVAANTSAKRSVTTAEAAELVKQEVDDEKPVDPEPTPAEPSVKATSNASASTNPAKSAAPKSWAALAAGAAGPTRSAAPAVPAVTQPSSTPASAGSQAKAAPSTVAAPPAASSTTAAQEPESPTTAQSGSEWQTAGHEHHKRQARPQSVSTPPAENSRAYIKHVSENVDVPSLRAALLKIADVNYVDINRLKSCAFVDFATPAGYQAAVAANPHEVNGEQIYVEERRIRPPGFNNYGTGRGGARGGRGGAAGNVNRDGYARDGGRGGYVNRGRGGNGNNRGRGGAAQAT